MLVFFPVWSRHTGQQDFDGDNVNANRQLHSKYNWPGRSRLDRAKKQTGKWRSSMDGLQSAGGWEKFSTGLGKIREGKAATLRIRIHEILGLFSRTKCF